MNQQIPNLDGLETAESVVSDIPVVNRGLPAGVRVNIRGRSVKLRGLKREPRGLWKWLLVLGPGLIATSAGNDAGGIATYSSAGAQFGYDLIWVMILLTVSFAVVQEMCARLGAATGRGLLDLIRERFGIGWTLFVVGIVIIANGGVTLSEFVGIGAASELLGVSRYISVPIGAALLWYLVIYGSYAKVEKIFLLMTLVFFAYPVAAILAHPDWSSVVRGAFVPKIEMDSKYVFLLVGVLGTTITPYIQIFQQSSIVERGAARRHYGMERVDAYVGSIFSNLMSISMIIATAATLFVIGQHDIESAADAAKALEPVAGQSAETLVRRRSFGRVAAGGRGAAARHFLRRQRGVRHSERCQSGFPARQNLLHHFHRFNRVGRGHRIDSERPDFPAARRRAGLKRRAAADYFSIYFTARERPKFDGRFEKFTPL